MPRGILSVLSQQLEPSFISRRGKVPGLKADDAAIKANRFWWQQQNRSLKQDCRKAPNCWLPRGHQGECQPVSSGDIRPTYAPGDYVKVEFPDKTTGIGEWMWVRVSKPDVISVLGEFLGDAERSHASLESKFTVGNWILSGKKFDRGTQPYQDFSLLVHLRNDLVHFKASDRFEEGVPLDEIHQNLINRFKDKNILAENISDKNLSWTFLVKTKAVAEWSCKTAAHMIGEFCTKIPQSDFRSWFLEIFEKTLDPQKLFPPA